MNKYSFTTQSGKGKNRKYREYEVVAKNFWDAVAKLKSQYPKADPQSMYRSDKTEVVLLK